MPRPTLDAPTAFLPPLRQLADHSPATIAAALAALRALYWPAWVAEDTLNAPRPDAQDTLHTPPDAQDTLNTQPDVQNTLNTQPDAQNTLNTQPDAHVPDSGYASAEDGEDEDDAADVLRADPLERAYAVRWLTGLIARCAADGDTDAPTLAAAAALLAHAADPHADGALARRFQFAGGVAVTLHDAPAAGAGVGLQTWGSARVLAARLCADPAALALGARGVRVLELGAGTGLLSLAAAARCPRAGAVVATDAHPAVLANLRANVARGGARVRVAALDWARAPPPAWAARFDVVLAADVVYDARHGAWLKRAAEALLRRRAGAVMWMILPVRATRAEMLAGVARVFAAGNGGLEIVHVEDVARQAGVGRADEAGYKLYRIAWPRA